MRIAIMGTGFVGSAYARALLFLGHYPVILSRAWFDYGRLDNFLQLFQPHLVINAVGYGGRTIDDCEASQGRVMTQNANCIFPSRLVRSLIGSSCKLIHISSGCIFNGPGPYAETDAPDNCCSVYVLSKQWAEEAVGNYPLAWIFRIRMPFNQTWHPRNLLVKLASYPRVLEGNNSLTFLDEFCMRSLQLIEKDHAKPGIYHAAYPTPVSTRAIVNLLLEAGVRTLPYEEYPADQFRIDGHVRRSQAILSARKFEENYGAPFGDPLVALRWCIDRMKESRSKSE